PATFAAVLVASAALAPVVRAGLGALRETLRLVPLGLGRELLGTRLGAVVAHRQREQGRGEVERVQLVRGEERLDLAPVQRQATGTDALAHLGEGRRRLVRGHVGRGRDLDLLERDARGALDAA